MERPRALQCGKRAEGKRRTFSGLFGIIEVRPSAGVCVGGTLVVHRVGGGGRGMKAGVGVGLLGFGPWAGLVPIRPEAPARFVCTGRKSQRRREAAMEGVSAAVLHSFSHSPPPVLVPPFCASLSSTFGTKIQADLLNSLRMLAVYARVENSCASAAVGRTRASACLILPN